MKDYYKELEEAERKLRGKGDKTPKSEANQEMEENRPEDKGSTDGTWRGDTSFMSAEDGLIKVEFLKEVKAPTLGQSAVAVDYEGDVIGGGIMVKRM